MCGINVILHTDGQPAESEDIARMGAVLAHRGPDGSGYARLREGSLLLGHTRLSIIDLAGGQQPIFNEDGTVALVFNGEIYDYRAIRRELREKGHRFRTETDSEVIVHLYEEMGLDFTRRLNGEFAFALWDARARRLILAKDRFGIKPMHFAWTRQGRTLLASSEAKGILAFPGFAARISPTFMAGPVLGSMDSTSSAFEGVGTLRPGHLLVLEEGAAAREVRYWQPEFQVDAAMSFEDARAGVRERLERAVARRLTADVPVAAYLSGGLDSTLVCALMARAGTRVPAFNIGFADRTFDEAPLARRIARHYGADFETVLCTPEGLAGDLLKCIWNIEGPITNFNSVAKAQLSAHVHARGYKVCLTGEGADELFGGYAYFKLERLWRMQRAGGAEAVAAQPLWRRFKQLEYRSEGLLWRRRMPERARTGHPAGAGTFGYRSFYESNVRQSERHGLRLLSAEMNARRGEASPESVMDREFDAAALRLEDPFNATRLHSLSLMSNYIIPKMGDRVEMANSVECRPPFLDHELAEFAFRIPPSYFTEMGSLREKHVLREAFRDELPGFLAGEHKHPFMAPTWKAVGETSAGRELFAGLLAPAAIREAGLFNPRFVRQLHALWRILPWRFPLAKRLDSVMGTVISMQALHAIFVGGPRAAGQGACPAGPAAGLELARSVAGSSARPPSGDRIIPRAGRPKA